GSFIQGRKSFRLEQSLLTGRPIGESIGTVKIFDKILVPEEQIALIFHIHWATGIQINGITVLVSQERGFYLVGGFTALNNRNSRDGSFIFTGDQIKIQNPIRYFNIVEHQEIVIFIIGIFKIL